ncbi:2-phospho-L-lactate guanylyltransferase [Aquabacter spiritensis]|uniref:3-phospho-D-glycerate guanylyltransferase n=1 Tax=Aquabacter spiritensis TaxID=933073 RepID=A0A4R3LWQ9_9HYPH|nr:2-phospho-L-lactate guanylyltransferase [Aquabacter spiritensis]TCT05003.1 phospholactate guanylyltransferase [Aquabacter spiritensis]
MTYPSRLDPVWALLPVKTFTAAKSRLSGCLSPDQRIALQQAMLADVLTAANRARSLDGVAVVTRDPVAAGFVRRFGAHVVAEAHVGAEEAGGCDLNRALADGVRGLRAMGAARALVVPADIPFLDPAEIDAAVALARGARAPVAVPSRDRGGTNGLVVRLDRPFGFTFGADSFRRHLANPAQGPVMPAALPSFALDVDLPADLAALRRRLPAGIRGGVIPGLPPCPAAHTALWLAEARPCVREHQT